jgi:hypothetical protein
VDDGRGSYIDIVLSIDPVATVPFWDVERDRIDLSLGPAYLSAEFAGVIGDNQMGKRRLVPSSEVLEYHGVGNVRCEWDMARKLRKRGTEKIPRKRKTKSEDSP